MAEILLSLMIIGVVAAITLPSLSGNINERTWNTQRKALYARMSQAIALMPAVNGYGTVVEATNSTSAVDTAAETFITAGLSKVLKINNICDSEHLEDCGITDTLTIFKGDTISNFTKTYNTLVAFNPTFNSSTSIWHYSQVDTKAVAFETANGESIILYYNPNCIGDLGTKGNYHFQVHMCANFVYDLNGSRGPNTVGKDIGFITVLYPSDSVIVAPMPNGKSSRNTQLESNNYCKISDTEGRLPNAHELAAIFYNKYMINPELFGPYWSSTVDTADTTGAKGWLFHLDNGLRSLSNRNASAAVYCIKRF